MFENFDAGSLVSSLWVDFWVYIFLLVIDGASSWVCVFGVCSESESLINCSGIFSTFHLTTQVGGDVAWAEGQDGGGSWNQSLFKECNCEHDFKKLA